MLYTVRRVQGINRDYSYWQVLNANGRVVMNVGNEDTARQWAGNLSKKGA